MSYADKNSDAYTQGRSDCFHGRPKSPTIYDDSLNEIPVSYLESPGEELSGARRLPLQADIDAYNRGYEDEEAA